MPRPLSAEQLEARRQAWLGPEKLDAVVAMLGTSRGRLCNFARREGWPPRPKGGRSQWTQAKLDRLEIYWNEGVPRQEIAEQLGSSISRIFQMARALKLVPRRPGKRRSAARR